MDLALAQAAVPSLNPRPPAPQPPSTEPTPKLTPSATCLSPPLAHHRTSAHSTRPGIRAWGASLAWPPWGRNDMGKSAHKSEKRRAGVPRVQRFALGCLRRRGWGKYLEFYSVVFHFTVTKVLLKIKAFNQIAIRATHSSILKIACNWSHISSPGQWY